MSKKPGKLERMVQELAEAQREFDRLVSDEEDEHRRGPPASRDQLATLERRLGKPLPPSYRAFLQMHNGWEDFAGGAKLLAVEDHESTWVEKRVKDLGDLLFEDDAKNPFVQGSLPVLLGKDENSYLVLDPKTAREDGEMEFVLYDYGEEEERFQDFTSFISSELRLMKALIKEEKMGVLDTDEEEEDSDPQD